MNETKSPTNKQEKYFARDTTVTKMRYDCKGTSKLNKGLDFQKSQIQGDKMVK